MMGKRARSTSLVALVVFLVVSQSISARLLPTYQDMEKGISVRADAGAGAGSSISMIHEEEDIAKLMGMEECGEGDEACLKRRMVAEAHLDYIYTQHQKHNGSP